MKNILIVAVALLFAASMALAQEQNEHDRTTRGTHETTVAGCLGGTPGHLTILTREGKTIHVQTNNPKADKLVGHSVVAHGSATPGAMTTDSAEVAAPNQKNTGAESVFTAGTIVDMSPTCKESSTQARPR